MEVGSLPRSTTSFRRQGSSGLVWDDKFLSGDLSKVNLNNHDQNQQGNQGKPDSRPSSKSSVGSSGMMQRSHSTGGAYTYRKTAAKHVSSSSSSSSTTKAVDPPSPKLSGCGFCVFGKPAPTRKHKSSKR